MTDILFVTWDGGGNVPPALGIARELAGRGHRVRFMGHRTQQQAFSDVGVPFTAFPSARHFSSADRNSPLALVAMFADKAMGIDVVTALDAEPADLVVVDCLLFGVMGALTKAGRRYVTLEHFYREYLNKWLRGPIGLGMRVKRLRTPDLLGNATARLVCCLPELDPASLEAQRDASTRYIGPVVSGVPATPASPTVLVSLSTFNFPGQREALQRILDALADLPVRTTVTTGPAIDVEGLRIPSGTEVHPWLPHAEVLPHVSLVIGHGGHATTMTALAHDVPVLVLPMHPMLDQPLVGSSVEAAGAGRRLPKKASASQIRQAVKDLLDSGAAHEAASRLGAAIRARAGATAGADALESLVSNGVPS